MHLSVIYRRSRSQLQMSGPDSTEVVIDLICIMSQLTKPDKTLFFPVYRVLWLCGILTKLYFYCNFMATAFENLIKHLKLTIQQLEELSTRGSADRSCRPDHRFSSAANRFGIPSMRGSEVVAALKGDNKHDVAPHYRIKSASSPYLTS